VLFIAHLISLSAAPNDAFHFSLPWPDGSARKKSNNNAKKLKEIFAAENEKKSEVDTDSRVRRRNFYNYK
jgi:hypothetical protein